MLCLICGVVPTGPSTSRTGERSEPALPRGAAERPYEAAQGAESYEVA